MIASHRMAQGTPRHLSSVRDTLLHHRVISRASSDGTTLSSVQLDHTSFLTYYASNRRSLIKSRTPPSLLNESRAILPGDRQPVVSAAPSSSGSNGSPEIEAEVEGKLGAGLARTVEYARDRNCLDDEDEDNE